MIFCCPARRFAFTARSLFVESMKLCTEWVVRSSWLWNDARLV
jgi:hypothetical protein